MSRPTITEFKRRFRDVIDPRDSIVVVYSGIWTFGHRLGLPIAQIPVALIEAMLEEVGSDKTLLLPAYTYAYAGTRQYSPSESAPETGILPVTLLKHFDHTRTLSALNSFVAVGPRAKELASIGGATLWGEGSLKAFFEDQHARIVVLGLPWKDACGFLHRIEEASHVPYRYHKTFHGSWEESGGVKAWSETMFVRPLSLLPVFQWRLVDDLLRSRGGIRGGGGEIHLESADAADLVAAGLEILADDKLALLTNGDDIRDWIKHGKAVEIAELRQKEPRSLDYFDSIHQ